MLEPIVDAMVKPPEGVGGGPSLARNSAMLIVVFCISPLTTWKNLTALKYVSAASMASVFTVGLCVAYRSIECQTGVLAENVVEPNSTNSSDGNMRAFPLSMKHLLDASLSSSHRSCAISTCYQSTMN
jgi:amino acid permease